MATKAKKDKKGAKKTEEVAEDKKTETPGSETLTSEDLATDAGEVSPDEPVPPLRVEPEPVEYVYDEPVLAELIIESYEGEKVKGLYDGSAVARFKDKHTYEGQFSEGLMHGKGKYTWSDGVIYEGDFYRNEVTGKGVYLWSDGSCYEGDVLRGKRHGQGVFRWKDSVLSYSGNWSQGCRNGKGRMTYNSGGKSFYDGDWVKNLRHGWGVCQYPSGNVYEGMWFNNVRHGQGTMKWIDKDQIYTGQWEKGIQHGIGQHIWILQRVPGSQYSLRNMYDGEFVNGLRHGYGTFYYANGASYAGFWKNNMKHGKGKFIFKNGRIYEGVFEHDHIVEFPDFKIDGATTPDISGIRTRTPLPSDNVSVQSNESRNTVSPNFQLEIDALLCEFPEDDREEQACQVMIVITRHISSLRKIYNFYSQLGYEESLDNTFSLSRMQFWRFAKDCHFHRSGITLTEMDRYIGKCYNKATFELHNPYERVLMRQFVNHLVLLAYLIYGDQFQDSSSILAKCLSELITENILRHACNVQGHFYYEPRRSIQALVYVDQSYEIFQCLCRPRKHLPREPAFKMRDFLFLLKDLKMINADLTAQRIVEVLSSDDPAVADGEGCYNLELEMSFLEFFEALMGCAEIFATNEVVKDPFTPRPSTVMTHDPSIYSMPACPSRVASQTGIDEAADTSHHTPTQESGSPANSDTARAPSSQRPSAGDHTGGEFTSHRDSSKVGPLMHRKVLAARASTIHLEKSLSKPAIETTVEHTQKSTSAISLRTSDIEDQTALMQSVVSIGGLPGAEDGEGPADSQEVEEELDQDTRNFNFWTRQVHVFFHVKFFNAAQIFLSVKKAVESRRIQEKLQQVSFLDSTSGSKIDVVSSSHQEVNSSQETPQEIP